MSQEPQKVLLVDDEPFNLIILQEYLEAAGYSTITAGGGMDAWKCFQEHGENLACALVDRMMPDLDGIKLVKKLKGEAHLKHIPIIMQTAAGASDEVREGMQAGVFYYLTKPFNKELLIGIVNSAITQQMHFKDDLKQLAKQRSAALCLKHADFTFRTIEEANNIALMIAGWLPDPDRSLSGISELAINAVEHGNLGITYKEKSALISEGSWQAEIDKRLESPEYKDKIARLTFTKQNEAITIVIADEGNGFDFENYLEFSPERLADLHGRGIAMSRAMAFDTMEYQKGGTQVTCSLALPRNLPEVEEAQKEIA